MNTHSTTNQIASLRDILLQSAATFGPSVALARVGGETTTYRELQDAARHRAALLLARGVRRGDRIALIAENRPEWGIWYFAITAMGATVVPILTDFHPEEVTRILNHATPQLVVVSGACRPLVGGWAQDTLVDLEESGDTSGTQAYDSEVFGNTIAGDDLAAILYTSGTTGTPKGVMLTHGNIVSNAVAARSIPSVGPTDRLLSMLPLAHSYECTIGFLVPMLSGASVTYLDGPPALSRVLKAMQQVKPTMVLSVPLILEKIYQSRVVPALNRLPGWIGKLRIPARLVHWIAARKVKRAFGGCIRFFGVGGAPLSRDTERFLRDGRFPYAIGYGLTETSPLLAGSAPRHTRFRSTGPALEGISVRIAETGKPGIAPGVGEIQATGPNVMKGYYRNQQATDEVFSQDGWFRTGDLGVTDGQGYLYVVGRLKTMILGPGGENVYPEDIEAVIDAQELVEESLVTTRDGKLIAMIRLNAEALARRLGRSAAGLDLEDLGDRSRALLDEIRSNVNSRLNRFSRISEAILQADPLERTPTRKIKRFLYQPDQVS